jgi:hypothetical protein
VCNNTEFLNPYQLKNYPSEGNEKFIFDKLSQAWFSEQHFLFSHTHTHTHTHTHIYIYIYITFVDRFTALRFTATSAPPAARRILILPMNQYAWWPIRFGIKGRY